MLLLLLLPLLLGCAGVCDPANLEIDDPRDLLTPDQEAELRAAHSDWFTWTATDSVCIDRVRPAELTAPEEYGPNIKVRGRTLLVDPELDDPTWAMYWGPCLALDEAENHTDARPELFRDDGSVDFPQVCAWGPGDIDWIDPIQSACGSDKLGDRERYMAEHVYVNGPRGRIDAELSATLGEPIPHPGSAVQLGDRMLLVSGELVDDIRTDTAVLYDPVTGVEEELWARTGDHDLREVGGRDSAVLVVMQGDLWTGVIFEVDGSFRELALDPVDSMGFSAIAHGAIWGPTDDLETAPLARLDLNTGVSTLIDLPATPDGLQQLVTAVEAVDDGILVQLMSAEVSVDGDSIGIAIHGYETWRYQDDGTGWTLLTTDLYMLIAGTDTQGRVVGSTFSDAGRALVAYDPDADQLSVSDDVCLWDDYPGLVTGDTLWLSTKRSGEWVYEPIHLAP